MNMINEHANIYACTALQRIMYLGDLLKIPFCLQFVVKVESMLYSELVPPGTPPHLWAAFEGSVTHAGDAGAGGDVVLHDKLAYWGDCHDYRNLNISGHNFRLV